MARDYYDVLGVGREADADAIKQAFRARAWELHPDVLPEADAADRFQEVSDAYEVLGDERSRRLYDRLGWRGRGRPWTPRPGVARVYASNRRAFLDDLDTLLAVVLGRRPAEDSRRVVAEVEVDPYEAYVGTTRTAAIEEAKVCPACHGQRRRAAISELDDTRFLALEQCAECGGTGEITGLVEVEVVIPPRARNSDTIPVGPNSVAVVRLVDADDAVVVRIAASVALLAAISFLLYLLAL